LRKLSASLGIPSASILLLLFSSLCFLISTLHFRVLHPCCELDNRGSSGSYGIWDANEELIVAWPFVSLF
jgi:hypothetical protein